jgi:hypothetical protein
MWSLPLLIPLSYPRSNDRVRRVGDCTALPPPPDSLNHRGKIGRSGRISCLTVSVHTKKFQVSSLKKLWVYTTIGKRERCDDGPTETLAESFLEWGSDNGIRDPRNRAGTR